MPQLDTSTWFTIILSMFISLFMLLQLKISTHLHPPNPQTSHPTIMKPKTPWETKWTKTYLPLLFHQQ
uniref:ATP synthase complex subunit 8 n=1 Tax=Coendou insidiosus TaxID=190504 RepID=M9NW56_9HYST|nr:ATP synthase F0 subunit 8 [Coendou insidiosus]AFQ55794.1 ATP synthase F0 subunit 8 [Coendou insidiosus]